MWLNSNLFSKPRPYFRRFRKTFGFGQGLIGPIFRRNELPIHPQAGFLTVQVAPCRKSGRLKVAALSGATGIPSLTKKASEETSKAWIRFQLNSPNQLPGFSNRASSQPCHRYYRSNNDNFNLAEAAASGVPTYRVYPLGRFQV